MLKATHRGPREGVEGGATTSDNDGALVTTACNDDAAHYLAIEGGTPLGGCLWTASTSRDHTRLTWLETLTDPLTGLTRELVVKAKLGQTKLN
jgi:hypothetical protein